MIFNLIIKIQMELDSSIIFDIFRLIIKNDNQTVEHQYMFIYDKYFWLNLLNNTDNNKSFDHFKESLDILKILRDKYSNKIKGKDTNKIIKAKENIFNGIS